MKSGKLTETITLRTGGTTINEYGTPEPGNGEAIATARAERVDQTTEEFMRGAGATDEEAVVFRIRFLEGVSNAAEVEWQGQTFNIKQVTPIGRRKGFELRCVRML